ncbi:MAG: hypothetical protein MJ252_26990 [archaeon]|nr:hypothetical protein [archaeon]
MESSDSNCPLKDGSINALFDLDDESSRIQDVNLIFQVLQVKQHETKNKSGTMETIIATLRDLSHKHTGFILVKDPNQPELEENDFVNILQVSVRKIANGKKGKAFIVKSYKILPEYKDKLYDLKDPVIYEESNEKEEEPQNEISMEEQQGNSIYTPLKMLTTFSRDFTILVRVTAKTEIKTFSNSHTPNGKLFSVNIIDKQGTEMQITCFNKVAEKFYEAFQKDCVYEIKGGYVKINDKKYTTIKSDYKLILDDKATVRKVEDDGEIKRENLSLVKIGDIPSIKLYSIIDICCTVLEVGEKKTMRTKNGEQFLKKIWVGDDSKFKVELSLWRNYADQEINKGDVMIVHHVKIGEYNGRNISSADSTRFEINSDAPELEPLRLFILNYDGEYSPLEKGNENGGKGNSEDKMEFQYLRELLSDDYNSEKTVPIRGTVVQINHSEKNFYMGCGNTNCKKKLSKKEDSEGYVCSGCGYECDVPTYYYTMSLRVKDSTAEYWIELFDKSAELLIKMPAEEYKEYVLGRDQEKLREISEDIEYKEFIFWVKAKNQTYGGNTKKRINASKVEPIKKNHFAAMLKNAEKQFSSSSGY